MGRQNRKTQHRPEREERRAKELQDLKRENQKLEKQVARLRKQVAKSIKESEEAEAAAQEDGITMRLMPMLPVDEEADRRMAELRAEQPKEKVRKIVVDEAACLHPTQTQVKISGPHKKIYTYCGVCKKRLGDSV